MPMASLSGKSRTLPPKKLGTLSSINHVKVLKEVFGDMIGENNLWYQIDGGKYPGAYVFSDYITPMVQPMPPAIWSCSSRASPSRSAAP